MIVVKIFSAFSISTLMLFTSAHSAHGMDRDQFEILGGVTTPLTLASVINHSIKMIEQRLGENWNRPKLEKWSSEEHTIKAPEDKQRSRREPLDETDDRALPFSPKWNVDRDPLEILGEASTPLILASTINHSIKVIELRLGENWNRPRVEKKPSKEHTIEAPEDEPHSSERPLDETDNMELLFTPKWNVNILEEKVNCEYNFDEQIIVDQIQMLINNSLAQLQKRNSASTGCIKSLQPLKDISNIKQRRDNSPRLNSLMKQNVQRVSVEDDAGSTEIY